MPSYPWDERREKEFRAWYAETVKALGDLGQKLHPDPDHPSHKYDYRGAFHDKMYPELTEHGDYRWPDKWKMRGHPVPKERK